MMMVVVVYRCCCESSTPVGQVRARLLSPSGTCQPGILRHLFTTSIALLDEVKHSTHKFALSCERSRR